MNTRAVVAIRRAGFEQPLFFFERHHTRSFSFPSLVYQRCSHIERVAREPSLPLCEAQNGAKTLQFTIDANNRPLSRWVAPGQSGWCIKAFEFEGFDVGVCDVSNKLMSEMPFQNAEQELRRFVVSHPSHFDFADISRGNQSSLFISPRPL